MDGRRQPTPTPALVSPMESPWRLSRQRQPRQQPDASRSRVLAVSSLGPGPRDREIGPAWGQTPASDHWLNHVRHPSPGGTLNRPLGTSLERLPGWIRPTSGLPATSGRARANRCCVHTTAEDDSDGSHSDTVPLGMARPGGRGATHHRWSSLYVLRGPLGRPCGHHSVRLPRVHYVDADRPHTGDGSPPLRSRPGHLYVFQATTAASLSSSKLG